MSNIVVVLGAGRSGTSLLMNLLVKMGVNISEQVKAASIQNTGGTFEDSIIFDEQTSLYKSFYSNPYLPLPDGWVKDNRVTKVENVLKKYILQKQDSAEKIFGFKDPRTAALLPMWRKIFNATKTTPLFIYIVRDPESVCASLVENYHIEPEVAELYWLSMNIDCIKNTGGNVFVVHYEDLLKKQSVDMLQAIDKHLGLGYIGDFNDLASNIIKPEMNRSRWGRYEIKNKWVKRFYKELLLVHGYDFDRSPLMELINASLIESRGYIGWVFAAHALLEDHAKKVIRMGRGIEKDVMAKKIELETMTKNNNDILVQNLDLKEELTRSRVTCLKINEKHDDTLQQNAELENRMSILENDIKRLKGNAVKLKATKTFRIARLLALAIKKPSVKIILLPYHMFKVIYK